MTMTDRREDILFWKNLALYLADCHAATFFHEGSLKSCSKSSRARFKLICERALNAIEGGAQSKIGSESSVAERLRKVVSEHD